MCHAPAPTPAADVRGGAVGVGVVKLMRVVVRGGGDSSGDRNAGVRVRVMGAAVRALDHQLLR